MRNNSFEEDVSYFVWPHINYFPVLDGQDENDFWRRFEKIMLRVVIPAVSLLGIFGNVTNMSILIRGKLNKSSTWLILALAAADTTFLMGVNNVPSQLYARGRKMGFEYPLVQAKVLYYVYFLQKCLEIVGKVSSMMLPCLITFDRLMAVTIPFRYSRILKVNRIQKAIGSVFLTATLSYIFFCLKFTFKYLPESQINITLPPLQQNENVNNITCVGILAKSSFFKANNRLYTTFVKIIAFLYGPLNLSLTVIGCVIVGVWVKIYTTNRKNLLANNNKSRTENTFFREALCLKKLSAQRSTGQPFSSSNDNRYKISSAMHTVTALVLLNQRLVQNKKLTTKNNSTTDTLSSSVEIDVFTTNLQPISFHKTSKNGHQEIETKCNKADQRLKVVNKRKGQMTRTLLSVCIVYSIANTINFFVLFYFDSDNLLSSNLAIGLETSHKMIMVLNSACNFLFYVGLNRNFKTSYRKFLCLCYY